MEQGRGLLRVVSSSEMMEADRLAQEAARREEQAKEEVLSSLAGHVLSLWEDAKRAKEEVRPRLLASLRQRRGEYDPDKLAEIRKTGGSEIFMMLTSVKCRAAGAWLRDVLLGQGSEKPWTVSPTPNPELPEDAEDQLHMAVGQEVGMLQAQGIDMPPDLVRQRIDEARKALRGKLREVAREKAQETERILEDELVEGGFHDAIDDFIDDFVTYPAAVLKGPVLHKQPVLTWQKQPSQQPGVPDRWVPIVEDKLVKRWYRVDPFKAYPAPWATNIEDGYFFEHHRITKEALFDLIGAPGYDEEAIRTVIEECGSLQHWLGIDWHTSADTINQPNQLHALSEGPMDALEFHGAVPGRMLMEWGVEDPDVNDPEKSYNVNLWLIGRHVIKASINPDPLGKKPYRKAAYEEIPGAFWGNTIPDLVRDTQDMCNAAARALANNMGLASGPQVAVNISRMPPDAKITQLYPWKIWQFESDPLQSTAPPMEFFQPNSNAQELIGVFQFFSQMADEYSGLPRYMSGDGNVGGAGRTASGLSALMSNSNKLMKSIMTSIDRIVADVLETLHQHLMQYEFDRYPELEGDVRVVARGAISVMAREQLALRRNEFLAATGANPLDAQILGMDGRAYLLREMAKDLGLDTDRIVPAVPQLPTMPAQGQPGQPGAGEMPGQPGQAGSQPAPPQNGRPVGATMDRPPMPG